MFLQICFELKCGTHCKGFATIHLISTIVNSIQKTINNMTNFKLFNRIYSKIFVKNNMKCISCILNN